jgi:tryptophanyl-tRNA synthetase
MSQPIVFSGIQPSGKIMLGNYLGALRNWVKLQKSYDCHFCLVNLHAFTTRMDAKDLEELSYEAMALYLAVGIDPDRSTLFIQSEVPEHTELAWILTCFSSMGELNRMTQFKDKSKQQSHVGAGLFIYPALMAADILLYQTDLVPVGEDQKQHLELARNLAQRLNHHYQKDLFKIPEPMIPKQGARVMSLTDPFKKMSKSDQDSNASVFFTDSDKQILKKFKKAVTDSGTEISFNPDEKPGISNLLMIQSAIKGEEIDSLVESYAGKLYGHLKVETGELVAELIRPIREEYERLISDKEELRKIFNKGRDKARQKAGPLCEEIKKTVGFI